MTAPHVEWGNKGDPGGALRELLSKEDVLVVPGVFNPATALLAQDLGFKAVYLSGAAITGSLAMPDVGLITLDELLTHVRWVCRVVRIPVIVDADTGFGEPLNVMRTVRLLIEAVAAAVQIEDQSLPKKCGHLSGKELIPAEDMVKKVRAAVMARGGSNLVIIARTDARGVAGLEEAIRRAKLYKKAGADVIFPEALRSPEEFRVFREEVGGPLLANMTEFGVTPYITVEEFKRLGYKVVVFPVTVFRASMAASKSVLEEIKKKGTQRSVLGSLMSREEFYKLIKYWDYERIDSQLGEKV